MVIIFLNGLKGNCDNETDYDYFPKYNKTTRMFLDILNTEPRENESNKTATNKIRLLQTI